MKIGMKLSVQMYFQLHKAEVSDGDGGTSKFGTVNCFTCLIKCSQKKRHRNITVCGSPLKFLAQC